MDLLLGAKQERHISTKFYCYQKTALRIINFSDRHDHKIPLFIDANVLPSNFSYYQYTISNLMHASTIIRYLLADSKSVSKNK